MKLAWKNDGPLPPMLVTFPGETKWSHLSIGSANPMATTGRRCVVAPWVIKFMTALVLKSHFIMFLCRKSGMEEWRVF